MSVVCPSGHESETADYCDQCGAPIAGATRILPTVEEADTSPAARREPCPACGAPRSGDDRYCEGCGYDFESPPPTATIWEAVVIADRAQFDRLAVAGVTFPTTPRDTSRCPTGKTESGAAGAIPARRHPRSTSPRHRPIPVSRAITPCSSVAPTAPA
jgi:hypothetical protein